MSANAGKTVRVILRWIQVLDKLEPVYKDHGEFFFTTRVSSGNHTEQYRLPEEGHWEVSDHPRFNKIDKIDLIIFEGPAGDSLTVELVGEEIDQMSSNDMLEKYSRTFSGDASAWAGRQRPGDEGAEDPENLPNWRVCYDIEVV
ncbi:MAG TPA: hypothetical protein VLA43_09375 [Longimicrobiales bacterium]|nr:hypothetical protein [Longimicrobiales bacterium]